MQRVERVYQIIRPPSPLNVPRKLISKLPPLMHNVSAKTLMSFDALSRPSFAFLFAFPSLGLLISDGRREAPKPQILPSHKNRIQFGRRF